MTEYYGMPSHAIGLKLEKNGAFCIEVSAKVGAPSTEPKYSV